jgi:hypothetical protein
MRFPTAYVCLLVVPVCCFVYCVIALSSYGERDIQVYRKLVSGGDPNNPDPVSNPYTATQQRVNLQKDVLLTDQGKRLQYRLLGAKAELVLDHREGQTEVVEHMRGVKCFMQEELYYALPDGRAAILHPNGQLLLKDRDPNDPAAWISADLTKVKPMQVMRYLEADKATYYYKNDVLVAETVAVSRYVLPGHRFFIRRFKDCQPMMAGVAQWVECTLVGKNFNFKAQQLKATFYPSGRAL